MYSLLVVDDEQYAVEGVMEAIDWKSIGIMAVYGAYSSEEAKNIIRQHDAGSYGISDEAGGSRYFKGYRGSCAESLAGGRKAGVPGTGI